MKNTHLPNVWTTGEVASYLRFSSAYIRKLADKGAIPCVQTEGGRHRRFLEPDILEYLRKRRKGQVVTQFSEVKMDSDFGKDARQFSR